MIILDLLAVPQYSLVFPWLEHSPVQGLIFSLEPFYFFSCLVHQLLVLYSFLCIFATHTMKLVAVAVLFILVIMYIRTLKS